ncbi:uncharacterized protein LOC142338389 isoform X2 [Convolutriloba macropyga]
MFSLTFHRRTVVLFACLLYFEKRFVYTTHDGFLSVRGEDACAPKYELSIPFHFGKDWVGAVYVCQNGYISLGTGYPQTITSPGEYNSITGSPIIAPVLIKNDGQHLSRREMGAFYEELDPIEYMDGTQDRSFTFRYDPYFVPDMIFHAMWREYRTSRGWRDREASVTIACDFNFPTSDEPIGNKCAIQFHYDYLYEVEDPVTGEYMRAGVYSSDGVIFELPDSGNSDVRFLDDRSNTGFGGWWEYEIVQDPDSDPIIREYQRSDCNDHTHFDMPENCVITKPQPKVTDTSVGNGDVTYTVIVCGVFIVQMGWIF